MTFIFKSTIILALLVAVLSSGCISPMEESPVLTIDLRVNGDYSNPVIDIPNISRSVEHIPLIKQSRYNHISKNPHVYLRTFYNMDILSYDTSVPYNGPGNYSFTVTLLDSASIPKTNDTINVVIQFIDKDGSNINKKYIGVPWPED